MGAYSQSTGGSGSQFQGIVPSYVGDYQQRINNYQTMRQDFSQRMSAAGAGAPFNEQYYLNSNPDVAAAVARGEFASGQAHYDQYGQAEGRQPGFVPMSEVLSPAEMWTRWIGGKQNKLDQSYEQLMSGHGDERNPKYNRLWDRYNSQSFMDRAQRRYENFNQTW